MTSRSEHTNAADVEPFVLDRHRLAMLQSLLGEEKAALTVERFKKTLETCMAKLASTATEPPEKGAEAHKLAGAAGTIGLQELCEACLRLEEAVPANGADLEAYLQAVLAAASRARDELASLK